MNASLMITAVFVAVIASALLHDFIPASPPTAVGIDLGTTFSCVAVFNTENSSVQVLTGSERHRIIPSIVAFNGNKVLVGNAARDQAEVNPRRTVFDAKRFIGRNMTEIKSDTDITVYPFNITSSANEDPLFAIEDGEETKFYSPEMIGSIILTKLKEAAEASIGRKVTKVVLAIPVEFNEQQRAKTEEAAKLAGLQVLRTIYEPTAAAMAYGLHMKKNINNIVVFDFGGGTLDVSLLSVANGVFEVLSKSGDKHLGGEDFNHNLLDHFLSIIHKKYEQDISNDKEALQRLRNEVERAKIDLSGREVTTVRFEFTDGSIFEESLSKSLFESINKELFERMLLPVSKVLESASITIEEVDEVVLVGGTTRIPRVREALSQFLNNKELNCAINPDEAVAYGTAIQAGILTDTKGITVAAVEQ